MIDLAKAVEILQSQDENKGLYPDTCKEFDEFWLFFMRAPIGDNDEVINSGTIFPIVYKDDGGYDHYDITSDIESYRNAKKIF